MGFLPRHIAFVSYVTALLLLPPSSIFGQEKGGDRILQDYFPDNEARDQAVITGRYAEAAHRHAHELIGPAFWSEGEDRLLYSDTARAFIHHARRRIDSTLHYAADSSKRALLLMERARRDLKEAEIYLRKYRRAGGEEEQEGLVEKAMTRTADASVSAFHASMLLGTRSPIPAEKKKQDSSREGRPKMRDKNLYDLMGDVKRSEAPDYEEKVSRLQVDRQSFRSLRDRYEERLEQKREKVRDAKASGAPEKRVERLQEKKELLALKKKDAAEQVEQIDEILQEKLLEHIGVDSTKGSNVFQVDRWGYYEEDPIPIDSAQPSGLVFRVQIGYYSKGNRPDEKLEGLYPIWGQRVSDKYVRYCVGRFSHYEQANKAKAYLREEKGFGDAFIVAYRDGEKVPVVEAIRDREE